MKNKKGKGLCIFLSLILVVEVVISAVKYPAFLLDYLDPGTALYDIVASIKYGDDADLQGIPGIVDIGDNSSNHGNNTNNDNDSSDDDGETGSSPVSQEQNSPGTSESVTMFSSSEITVRYDESEYQKAPSKESSLKRSSIYSTEKRTGNDNIGNDNTGNDNTGNSYDSYEVVEAVCGDIRVEFDSWNLDNPNDTLIVKELPEKVDDKHNCTLKCWDFSLASGQHQFYTNLVLHFPVEADDGPMTGFVWYNPEADVWEDLYTELSKDGSEYLVYINHFTDIAKKKFKGIKTAAKPQAGLSGNTDLSDLPSIFWEEYDAEDMDETNMTRSVDVDFTVLWKIEDQPGYWGNNNAKLSFEKATQRISDRVYVENSHAVVSENDSEASSLLGDVNAGATFLDWGGAEAHIFGWSTITSCFNVLDILLTLDKVYEDLHTDEVKNVIKKNGWGIAGSSLTAISLGLTFAGSTTFAVPLAVAGLLIWGNGILEGMFSYNYSEPEESVYRDFYLERFFNFSGKQPENCKNELLGRYYKMKPLPSMSEKDFETFRKYVNKHPLTDNVKSWVPALSKLYKMYAKRPAELETVVDELYDAFARAYYRQSDKVIGAWEDEWFGDKVFCGKYTRDDYYRPTKHVDYDPFVTNYVKDLKARSSDILLQLFHDSLITAKLDLEKRVKEELLPRLNSRIDFVVEDTSLEPGQKFSKSKYAVDFRKIEANKEILYDEGEEEIGSQIITPMRFLGVKEPLFLPTDYDADYAGTPGTKERYYPYTTDFLPRYQKGKDTVFSCTLYHYVMMGCPSNMVFTEVTKKTTFEEYEKAPTSIVAFGSAEKLSGKKKGTYRIVITTDEVPDFFGTWKGSWGYSEGDGAMEAAGVTLVLMKEKDGIIFALADDASYVGTVEILVTDYTLSADGNTLTLRSDSFVEPMVLTMKKGNKLCISMAGSEDAYFTRDNNY